MDKESVNGLLVSPDDGIGSPQRSNSVESSPGGLTRKGFGLKKWRRIKRDTPVKEEAAAHVDDGSKLLKRNLTGLVNNPRCKRVDLSSVEARQSSEGSVGSVKDHLLAGVVNGFSPVQGFMFNVGQGFDKSQELSGNSIAAKNVVGGGNQGMGSDFRSGGFVEVMMNHIEEGEAQEQVQTHSRSENGGRDGDECNKKKDQIADSIRSLAALQEALWKEVTSFQELSKESIQQHSNIDEVNSGSEVRILKQKVKHLLHKLEEARADLDAKEARIQELENSMIESELEGVFQRKIEAEIEHLLLTSSLDSSLQVLKEESKKVHSVTEDPDMLGKTCKSCFYFLTQMILLVFILRLLLQQSSPASPLVIPT